MCHGIYDVRFYHGRMRTESYWWSRTCWIKKDKLIWKHSAFCCFVVSKLMWSEWHYWWSRLQAERGARYAKIYNKRRQLKLDFHWVVMKKTWFIELREGNDTIQRKGDREKMGTTEEKEGGIGWWKAADLKRVGFLWLHFESTKEHCFSFIVCL